MTAFTTVWVLIGCVLIGFILSTVSHRLEQRRRKRIGRKLITVPLVKMVYNPLDGHDCWMWTKFNPRTRTWEWKRDATIEEVEQYQGIVFNEIEGDVILNAHMVCGVCGGIVPGGCICFDVEQFEKEHQHD